jgi:hypothetical protein
MRFLRGLGASLVWLVACLLGLVSLLLCVTIILLPLGIPLLGLSRRLFGVGTRLMLPPAAKHPVREGRKSLEKKGHKAKKRAQGLDSDGVLEDQRRRLGKKWRRARKRVPGNKRRSFGLS